jgi:hypothetical protein
MVDGNERADKAAKQAHTSTDVLSSYPVSYSNIKNGIVRNTLHQWETQWNKMITKLNEIIRTILPWTYPSTPQENMSQLLTG